MSASSLILVGILAPGSGIIGSLVWPRVQRKFGWTNLRVLGHDDETVCWILWVHRDIGCTCLQDGKDANEEVCNAQHT